MGLKPHEIGSVTMYDFNIMVEAHNDKMKHDYQVMRMNAYLVSVYSGLEGKARRKLSPNKMFPLEEEKEKTKLTREEVQSILARSNKRRGIC